jgi:hypothetical protein
VSPLQQPVRKGGLSVVDVSDDTKIPYVFLFHTVTPRTATRLDGVQNKKGA